MNPAKNILLALVTVIPSILFSCSVESGGEGYISFNDDWRFLRPDSLVLSAKTVADLDEDAWESVTLPHTAVIEPSVMNEQQWTGICWYKKAFSISWENRDRHIGLLFEAMMNDAVVWLNGTEIRKHQGGYLPFYLDISDLVKFNKENTLLIRLDNRDNPSIPPGKSLATLDFNYYSGIYRNAFLVVKNRLHFTDPMETDTIQGGGIIVNTEELSPGKAILGINQEIRNQDKKEKEFIFKAVLKDSAGREVAESVSGKILLSAGGFVRIQVKMEVPGAQPWSPSSPVLYTLVTSLNSGSHIHGVQDTRIGIRKIEISAKGGFRINREKLNIRGTNRHQEYPYIGNALSDNAQYRDAWKIKKAGFNFVRCSHYPHSPAFLDACDELGILVMDAIPGWQFIGDSVFVENSYRDTREMVRRDRNHPSIILWENSLNETRMPLEYIKKSNEIVFSELPFEGIYTCGWMDTLFSVFIPARQHARPPEYWSDYSKDKPIFISEYGDWEYYAQNAGFNQTEFRDLGPAERSSRQLRSSGEMGMLQQAFNYQESHNQNLYGPAIGDANWLIFDYNRGYAPDIESSGIMDIFRIPKFAFWFYKSQSDDEPVCFIASFNTPGKAKYIRVFSNGDSVSLYRDGIPAGTQSPDKNINTLNLLHPPFTFEKSGSEPGILRADSWKDGRLAATYSVGTAGTPAAIKLDADYSGKALSADGTDVIFIYASVTDDKGNLVHNSNASVRFSVEGDASLVGTNPVPAEAGIAAILLRAGKSEGKIKVSADSNELLSSYIEIYSKKQPPRNVTNGKK